MRQNTNQKDGLNDDVEQIIRNEQQANARRGREGSR